MSVDGILVMRVVLGGVATVEHGDRTRVIIVGEVIPAIGI